MEIMYSAAEIADMGLPFLPKTKAAIIKKAEKEGWEVAEKIGLGGIRKMYVIPKRYINDDSDENGLSFQTITQAALSAHKASNQMGFDDEQFLGLFKTLCGVGQTTERRMSMSANTKRAQINKKTVTQQGDGNNINVNKIKGDVTI